MHSFSSLKLSASILHTLTESGYTTPTPIQAQTIPAGLAGRDILGCAQTGTGKTAAFALPIIERLKSGASHVKGAKLPRALVLAPTRELAVQIAESFVTYGKSSGITVTTVFGGVSQLHQVRALQRGVDVVVATPGRLMDLMQQRHVNLSAIQTFVLDEADRMLDMGFIQPIRQIASAVPTNRQTLLFSATMPREIVKLAESLLRDPLRVSVAPVASTALKIEQCVHMVGREQKIPLLTHWLKRDDVQRSIVFVRTKHGADKLSRKLCQSGLHSEAIHGNRNQNQRQRSLDAFRSGRTPVLVATDVAARGIDIDDVTHVFNFDLPREPEAYVHRIGRTGRAGAAGTAVAFCEPSERSMLKSIEKLIGKQIERAAQVDLANEQELAPVHSQAKAESHAKAHPYAKAHSHSKAETHTKAHPHAKPGTHAKAEPHARVHAHTKAEPHAKVHAHAKAEPHSKVHPHTKAHAPEKAHSHAKSGPHSKAHPHTKAEPHSKAHPHTKTHSHAKPQPHAVSAEGHGRKHAPSTSAPHGGGGRKQHPLQAARGASGHAPKTFAGGSRRGPHMGRGGARRKLQGARGPR